MKNLTKRNSLDEIQLARAFAIIAVMVVHSSSSGVTSTEPDSLLFPIYNFLNIAGKLGTPTFIMLSSFVLFYNYYPRETSWDLMKRFYTKRLKYILIPYILFSAIYFVLKWYVYYDYPTIGAAFSRFVELTALGKAHPHLYFVFISVQLYILFPLLLIMFKKSPFLRKNAIWIGILLQWLWVILNKNYFHITLKGSISLSYLSFYFIGAYLGIYYNEIRAKMKDPLFKDKVIIPLFISYGAIVILYTGYMYLVRIGAFATVAPFLPDTVNSYLSEFTWAMHALIAGQVLFYLSHIANKKFTPRMKMIFMEIGATSFGIYLIHPLFLMLFRAIYDSGTPLIYHGWQILTFILIGICSWVVVRFTARYIPQYWIIFGKMPPMEKFPVKK
ncbi:acyltransferase [Oceanobacillus damuensis]|uniref:acyltransferase n=1 Tax=Oceanobacillus damuensis TaxID=937928 RepID=UPI00082C4DDF|nr:acyltransferase [Oceanobacillus damuensis]